MEPSVAHYPDQTVEPSIIVFLTENDLSRIITWYRATERTGNGLPGDFKLAVVLENARASM